MLHQTMARSISSVVGDIIYHVLNCANSIEKHLKKKKILRLLK
jgi:hypothetical protein